MKPVVVLGAAALLAGCSLAPDFLRPPQSVSAAFPDGAAYHSKTAVTPPSLSLAAGKIGWRDFFTDPALRRLLQVALRSNRDLRTATIDVFQAKAYFQLQRASLFPSLNVTGNATYEGESQYGLFTTGGGGSSSAATGSGAASGTGSAGGGASVTTPTGSSGGTLREFTVSAGTTSYEVDLFGRVRNLTRQEFEKYLAQQENQRAVALTVIGNVATTYITWLSDQALLKVTEDTLRAQSDSLRLTQAEFDHGAITLLVLRQAQTSVATARANQAQYTRAVAQDVNELVLLLGAPIPDDLPPPRPLGGQTVMADLAPGLPSDLLTRRPDIMKAEHTLRGDYADIGAARAAFFPQLTLTGTGGLSSLQVNKLFTPGALTWTFAPQLSIPIFTWGQNQANLDIAKTQRDLDVVAYEQTVQTAFHDVANALTARATYRDQALAQQQDVDASADYYRLAMMRFRAGVDTYLTALDAQRTLYSAQQALLVAQEAQLQNLVTMYQVLGGGWPARAGSG
jgi:multidrug efflux system outer membrane protein